MSQGTDPKTHCPKCGQHAFVHDNSLCSMRFAPKIMDWIELPKHLLPTVAEANDAR